LIGFLVLSLEFFPFRKKVERYPHSPENAPINSFSGAKNGFYIKVFLLIYYTINFGIEKDDIGSKKGAFLKDSSNISV
jgi:hypothetical protein